MFKEMFEEFLDSLVDKIYLRLRYHDIYYYSKLNILINKIREIAKFNSGQEPWDLDIHVKHIVEELEEVKNRNNFLESENVDLIQKLSFLKQQLENNEYKQEKGVE